MARHFLFSLIRKIKSHVSERKNLGKGQMPVEPALGVGLLGRPHTYLAGQDPGGRVLVSKLEPGPGAQGTSMGSVKGISTGVTVTAG